MLEPFWYWNMGTNPPAVWMCRVNPFFSRVDKPSEDIASRLFFMNMKGLMLCDIVGALSAVAHALF
jgi:hypothetical protein